MIKTNEEIEAFEEVCKPLMKWLCDNCHPHVVVVAEPTRAELLEGVCCFNAAEFVRD